MLGAILTLLVAIQLFFSLGYLVHSFFFPTSFLGVPLVASGIIVLLVYCFVHSVLVKGIYHSLVFLILSFVITYLTEYLGVNHGLWFGDYYYTDDLGPKITGVPLLVIAAWEGVIYPSHLLVDWLSGLDRKGYDFGLVGSLIVSFIAAAATALFVTAWDLMTDPLAVHLGWWVWESGGSYLRNIAGGVPLSNYWGWFSAVFIISFSYRTIFSRYFQYREKLDKNPLFLIIVYTTWYVSVSACLLAIGIKIPVFIATFTMGPVIVISWLKFFAGRL